MPSIQASSPTAAAMAYNYLPPVAANETKPTDTSTSGKSAARLDTVSASDTGRSAVSDRVSAFLATDQIETAESARPNRPPPPPRDGPPPEAASASGGESVDESETALLLLQVDESEDEEDDAESDEDSTSQAISILFDDTETYQPTSLY